MAINRVLISGNVVRDPEVRYSSTTACARVTVALNRGKSNQGDDLGADFPQAVFWGKLAENVEKYVHKGMLVTIEGKIRTGSYKSQKTGSTVYYTEIAGDKIEFFRQRDEEKAKQATYEGAPYAADISPNSEWATQTTLEGFSAADDIPF